MQDLHVIKKNIYFFLITCLQRGRSIIGQNVSLKLRTNKFSKIHWNICYAFSKIAGYAIYKQGGINGERLLKFLQVVLRNKIIILDNTSSHKNEKAKKFK